MKDLMGMIPGVGKAMKNMDIPDDAFKGIEAIIKSMTPEERKNPSVINGSRRARIAKGSGNNIEAVNKLMKQFDETRKMMKMMGDKSKMQAMMQPDAAGARHAAVGDFPEACINPPAGSPPRDPEA
jgi:signal recognition particle subunit SRP54